MEDKFTNKENQLRELSDELEISIDTDSLWNSIETQLPPVEKERNRPFFWWFNRGIAMITILAAMWMISTDKTIEGTDQNELTKLSF